MKHTYLVNGFQLYALVHLYATQYFLFLHSAWALVLAIIGRRPLVDVCLTNITSQGKAIKHLSSKITYAAIEFAWVKTVSFQLKSLIDKIVFWLQLPKKAFFFSKKCPFSYFFFTWTLVEFKMAPWWIFINIQIIFSYFSLEVWWVTFKHTSFGFRFEYAI